MAKEKKEKKEKKGKAEPETPLETSVTESEISTDVPPPPPSRKSEPPPIQDIPKPVTMSVEKPAVFGVGAEGAPPMMGKPGWRRVSTRQWIRDFREHIGKYQTYPYKPICGAFFWSFGYYPDMVPQDSYQRYVARHPIGTKRHSGGSGHGHHHAALPPPMPMAMIPMSDTSMSMTSTTGAEKSLTSESSAANMPPPPKRKSEPPPRPSTSEVETEGKKGKGDKSKKGKEAAAEGAEPAEDGGKKKKGKGKGEAAAEGAEPAEDGGKKKKGKGKGEAAAAEGAEPAEEGGKKKKGKGKGGEADAPPASEEGGGKKGKGGKTKPLSAVSGNISFDPAVYDLTTLTVMNLPAGADEKKLKKLFPGAQISMEAGGASVKFPDAAAAEPFFTKNVAIDGQALVVSPKLKS